MILVVVMTTMLTFVTMMMKKLKVGMKMIKMVTMNFPSVGIFLLCNRMNRNIFRLNIMKSIIIFKINFIICYTRCIIINTRFFFLNNDL